MHASTKMKMKMNVVEDNYGTGSSYLTSSSKLPNGQVLDSKFFRAFCEKLPSANQILWLKHRSKKNGMIVGKGRQGKTAKDPGSYHASSSSSSSRQPKKNGRMPTLGQIKDKTSKCGTDEMHQWRFKEESMQSSPSSSLDRIEVHHIRQGRRDAKLKHEEVLGTTSFKFPRKAMGGNILVASLWELMAQSRMDKTAEAVTAFGQPSSLPQYIISKKVVKQAKRDCVRVVESRGGKQERDHKAGEELIEPEAGMIFCRDVKASREQPPHHAEITKLEYPQVLGSLEEWKELEAHRREIIKEIAESIFQDIKEEMVDISAA
ncbi:hypothetical protein Dimus_027961 [Dionaea muscipula]